MASFSLVCSLCSEWIENEWLSWRWSAERGQWWFFCASSDSFLEHFDANAIKAAKEASSFEDWFREVNVNADRRSKSELPFVTGPAEKKIKIGDASDHLYMS